MKNSKALHRFTLIPMLAALAAVISPAVQAQSLVDLYTAARGYDATFQSAKSSAFSTPPAWRRRRPPTSTS
jgi:competence protein ComGF